MTSNERPGGAEVEAWLAKATDRRTNPKSYYSTVGLLLEATELLTRLASHLAPQAEPVQGMSWHHGPGCQVLSAAGDPTCTCPTTLTSAFATPQAAEQPQAEPRLHSVGTALKTCTIEHEGQFYFYDLSHSTTQPAEQGQPRREFPVGLLGHPMREFAPGKWESAIWPSEAAEQGERRPFVYALHNHNGEVVDFRYHENEVEQWAYEVTPLYTRPQPSPPQAEEK